MNDDPPYDIQITAEATSADLDPELARRGIVATLRRFDVTAAQLSLALVDDACIADLHRRFLDIPGPTDVLTFDLSGGDAALDGEIVVSIDTARRCAEARGHSVSAEVALYAIHGTLHLLGMDDHGADDARRMHATEDTILESLGLGPVFGDC